jgi:hypothetical protein
MNESEIFNFYGKKLVKQSESLRDCSLSIMSKHILIDVGIPPSSIINFTPSGIDKFIKNGNSDSYLLIGRSNNNEIGVSLVNETVVILNTGDGYVNKNIQCFVETIYSFDIFHLDILEKRYGDIRTNRKRYVDKLNDRLREIDETINERGYFWPGLVESIEFGIVYS